MKVTLISTYELGRQPFVVASAAAWLRARGHQVIYIDTSRQSFPLEAVCQSDLIAFYLPMHTATRLAVPLIRRVRENKPNANICCYGLYAPMNEPFLRGLGVSHILGGEFEAALENLADGHANETPLVPLPRLQFLLPDRSQFPVLSSYATLSAGGSTKIARARGRESESDSSASC